MVYDDLSFTIIKGFFQIFALTFRKKVKLTLASWVIYDVNNAVQKCWRELLKTALFEYSDRMTFNQTFNVIFLNLSRFLRLRVWFLETVFSRINGSFYYLYVRNILYIPYVYFAIHLNAIEPTPHAPFL